MSKHDPPIVRLAAQPKTDVEWTQTCIAFLESHPFRTRYAQLEYHERRATNLVALHKLLRKQIEEAARQVAEQTKASKGLSRTVEDSSTRSPGTGCVPSPSASAVP